MTAEVFCDCGLPTLAQAHSIPNLRLIFTKISRLLLLYL